MARILTYANIQDRFRILNLLKQARADHGRLNGDLGRRLVSNKPVTDLPDRVAYWKGQIEILQDAHRPGGSCQVEVIAGRTHASRIT